MVFCGIHFIGRYIALAIRLYQYQSIDMEQNQPEATDPEVIKELMSNPNFMKLISHSSLEQWIGCDPEISSSYPCRNQETYQSIEALQKVCQKIPKGVCAASIEKHEQVYKCMECGRETEYHVFCHKCFESGFLEGKHKGHRFKAKRSSGGCCDCGDIGILQKEGFCSLHTGERKCDEKLDEETRERLEECLVMSFHILFQCCDQMTPYLNIFPPVADQYLPTVSQQQLEASIQVIVTFLTNFITEFGKDKLPLQYAISQILISPLNRELDHVCNSHEFDETFCRKQRHVCSNSILSLLFKYGMVTDRFEQQISKFVYSLFVNFNFRLSLTRIFLEHLRFTSIFFDQNQITFMITLGLNMVYCQLLGGKLTESFITCPQFKNMKEQAAIFLKLINSPRFLQLKNIQSVLNMYNRIQEVCESQRREQFSLRLVDDMFELSDVFSARGLSFKHHQYKSRLQYMMLNLFVRTAAVVKYQDQSSRALVQTMIQRYFEKLSEDKGQHSEPQNEEESEEKIIFRWYCQPQLCLGTLLISYYNKYGKESLSKLLEPLKQKGHLRKYIKRVIAAQTSAYTISTSNEVGFPYQLPPKELYRIFYRHPFNLRYDCALSILQVLSLIAPEQLINGVEDVDPKLVVQLLADLVMEESCFVNFASRCCLQSKLVNNSLKIEVINVLNLRNKLTFAEMKSLFLENMFLETVEFNHAFSEVASYDYKSESYTIKEEYKNCQEVILIKRSEDTFGNFFEKQESELKLLQKDNLFKRQVSQGWDTLCKLATEQLGKCPTFSKLFERIVSYIWSSNLSNRDYQNIRLIYVILLRNLKDERLASIAAKAFNEKPETHIQQLVHQTLRRFNQQSIQASEEKPTAVQSLKPNRMKVHYDRLKKQQHQFMINNPELFKEEESEKQKVEEESMCLICHQGQVDNQCPVFTVQMQFQFVEGEELLNTISCGHLFHIDCLKKSNSRFCPVCKSRFDNLFPLIPSSEIHMLDPKKDNTVTCTVDQKFFYFYLNQLKGRIMQGIFTRIYFSILDSCAKFVHKDLRQLRSIYSKYLTQGHKDDDMKTEEELMGILQKKKTWNEFEGFNRTAMFIELIRCLLTVPFYKRSLETKRIFDEAIFVRYTVFFADNFLCFIDEESKEDLYSQVKLHQDSLNAKMNQFCKGVIFTYALLFDDQRNSVLETIADEDTVGEILTAKYPEFFKLQKNLFEKYVGASMQNKAYKSNTPQSLLPIPPVIEIPENYMQFHRKYYDLKCDQCKGIARFSNNELWLCLLCGSKSCLQRCPALNMIPKASIHSHFAKAHLSTGIAIDLNSSMIAIIEYNVMFLYGHLYENQCGEYDNEKIKDWTSLRLQTNRWNKLLEILRKRMLKTYAIQNELKLRVLGQQNE